MEDASAAAGQETLAKAAPAATTNDEGVVDAVKSAVSGAAEAASTFIADDDAGVSEHDEL